MTETPWTPGPWHVTEHSSCKEVQPDIFIIRDANGVEIPDTKPNAVIRAAAPDLYEALAELYAEWEADDTTHRAILTPSIQKARAALKKARGEG